MNKKDKKKKKINKNKKKKLWNYIGKPLLKRNIPRL